MKMRHLGLSLAGATGPLAVRTAVRAGRCVREPGQLGMPALRQASPERPFSNSG
jgi:hypothetical protein